jgi:hypothetical protein
MASKRILTCILLLVLAQYSFSQFAQRMDMTGGGIGASYTVMPTRSFKDTTGGFGYQAFGGSLNLQLFGNRNKIAQNISDNKSPHFYQTSFHAGFESLNSTIGFVQTQRSFYTASAGLGGLFYNGKKNIFLIDASVGFASDQFVFQNNDVQYRFTGSFIVNHIHSASVMYFYGIAFSYAYGRPLPLPVLGIRKKFSKKWSMTAILPLSVDFTDRMNKDMSLNFLLRPLGNRFQFENKNDFDTSSSTVYMQLRQFELGTSYIWRFAKQFSFSAEAGLLGGGNVKFTEINSPKTILYESGIKGGTKFRFSIRYLFTQKKATPENLDFENEMFRMN